MAADTCSATHWPTTVLGDADTGPESRLGRAHELCVAILAAWHEWRLSCCRMMILISAGLVKRAARMYGWPLGSGAVGWLARSFDDDSSSLGPTFESAIWRCWLSSSVSAV
jgi:hypothetical protein